MLPGKTYTPEDVVRILVGRWWLVVIPLVVCAAAGAAIGSRLPNRYRSETLIMLVPQRIPDSYVRSTVTSRIEDRLATLQEQLLSRSRLERIILDLDLYSALRRTLPMEDVVQRMRSDIDPIRIEGRESFRISYVNQDARTAQKTTERLASLFIEENLRDRENLAEDTNQFLESQLEDAKRRLVEYEKKLEEYRSRYGGELPSQATANLQAIQNLQTQLRSLAEATDRARERRLLLERQMVDLQSDPLAIAAVTPTGAQGAPQSTAQQLQAAQARLELLLSHATPDHPDVRTLQRSIRDLDAKLAAEGSQPADGEVPETPVTPTEALRQKRIRDLKADIADIDRQLAEKQGQDEQLRKVIAQYEARLAALPRRESDLVELTRDYATLQTAYQALLAKREDAKIAANLERRNIGEQFRVLDPARIPERPFSPIRWQIDLMGAASGLMIGLLFVGLREYRDSSFKTEDEVTRVLSLPVLALVPTMISTVERETRRRRALLAGGVAVLVLGSAAIAFWRLWPSS
ncbi:MAG: hypothetical protein A3G76_03980 [Acidobacteria bacterium RIFCSPLOWO2_12_FULL_65_11]|nr:MAG: hypothetical protein A3H95_05835 [Acidobacteria bacterium RIFCSPLOWO2_02_FULL_64_15]OFW33477.1 MAG: hypothetical protein A3G76_03980 [Acidobacteria bacterium RIFCSPLOWO2_12_FULL_65_11]